MLLANVLILLLGILSAGLFPQVLKTPKSILFPVIFTLCFLGAFSLNNSVYDIFIALIFGIIGYIVRKNGFPLAPIVLGVILGPIAEDEFSRALIISHGDWTVLFQSPIAIFFYVISIFSLLSSLKRHFSIHPKTK
jgi:putative tricarboxylic transport membrane protein